VPGLIEPLRRDLMVCRAPKPNLRLASCCRVEVMKGGAGLRVAGFASTV
jgi:hypothetical protein